METDMTGFGVAEVSIWHIVILLALVILTILPFWKIFSEAGFSPWLSLLMLVPIINFLVLYYVAFAKWGYSDQRA